MTDANLPSTETQPSAADRQRARLDNFMSELDKRNDMLSTLLSDSGVDPKVFLAVARRALQNNPDIMNCNAGSVLKAFIDCATDGLVPDGRQAAIVVYKQDGGKIAQYQPMYSGLLSIAYRSGNFKSIEARVVYEGDFFEYELGDDPFIKHRPKSRPAGLAPAIIAAYAVAKTTNGGIFREIFEGDDIRKVNAVSRAKNGPAKNWSEEMARKGPLRRLWKFLPRDARMERVLEHDNETYDLDTLDVTPEPERKLKAGFAAPVPQQQAITQGTDLPIDVEMEDVRDEEPEGLVDAQPKDPPVKEQAKVVEPDPEEEPLAVPETFQISVNVAKSFLNLKQALRVVQRTAPQVNMHVARRVAWGKFVEVNDVAEVKADFVTDPVLFQMWLDGTLPAPDQVDKNWALVQRTEAFGKLSDQDKEAVAAHVAQARGGRAMEESQS